MIIDCGSCTVAGAACDDCVVTVLLGPSPFRHTQPDAAVASAEIPDEHAEAVAVLADTGLIPPLRLVTRAS